MARAALLLLLLPSLALAQVTVTESSGSLDDELINRAECLAQVQSNFVFNWTFATTTVTQSVELRVSNEANCPTTADTDNTTANTDVLGTFTGATGTSAVQSASNLAQLVGLSCEEGTSRPLHVCAIGTNGVTETTRQTAIVQVDTALPTTPLILEVSPGEGALEVVWELSSNADRYRVEATPQGRTTPNRWPEVTGNSRRIGGLVNGTTYDVRVIGISKAGNESAASAPVPGTPQEVSDFWEAYRNAGGNEQGGCGVGGGGALALLGLVPLVLRRRRP